MKLLRLELTNFRQHRSASIEFQEGITGIIGNNGAGKTSLIEGIAFALFGSRSIRGKVEDLRTRGVKDTRLEVQLTIDVDGHVYRVVRTATDAELYSAGEATPIVTGNREVVARVSTLVGMSYEEFIATYFTEQKGLEFLSGKKGATEREKFIVRMMGYDKLEKVQDLLRTDRRDKKNAAAGWEAGLGDRDALEARLASEKEELGVLEKTYDEKCTYLEKLNSEIEIAKQEYEKLEVLRREWLVKRQAVLDLQAKSEDRAMRAKTIEAERSRHLSQEWNGRPLRELFESGTLEALLSASETRITALETRGAEIQEALHAQELIFREGKTKAQSRSEMVKTQIAALKKKVKGFSVLDATSACPTCGQELGGSFKTVKSSLDDQIAELLQVLSDIDGELELYSAEPKEMMVLREDKTRNAQELESEISALKKFESARTLSTAVQRFDVELVTVRDELKSLDEKLGEGRKELSAIRFAEDDYAKKKASYDASSELLNLARLQKMQVEGDVKAKQALFQRTRSQIEEFDSKKTKLTEVKKELILLEEGDRLLTDFRKALNAGIRPRLAELASEFLTELTDGRYSEVDIGSDFTPSIVEDGEPKPVISGGEQDILNLSVRLALSHMLAERAGQTFSLLVLDEVFGSLDEGRRFNVLGLLERLSHRFEQILVITHMDDIKEGVEHLLQVSYDEDTGLAEVSEGSFGDEALHF